MSFFARLMLARNTPSPHPEEGRGEGPTLPDGDRCTTSRYKTHSTANVFRKPWPLTPTLSPEGRGGRSSLCYACTALLLLAFAGLADADTATDLRTAAEQAVRAQYGTAGSRVVIVPTPLNARLHLAACDHPLQTRLPVRQGTPSRVAVSVSCAGTPGWTIQVPVQLQVFRNVLVTNHPLARGDILGPGDVHPEERDVARLGYGFIESLDQILGHSLGRPLIAGVALTPGDFNGRETVHAGEEVQLVASVEGIEVRTRGMALDGGDTGARLRVRNDNSGRVIQGVVVGEGQVQALP